MEFIAGLGGLLELAGPFVETPDERMAYDREMAKINADIAKYQAQVDTAKLNVQETVNNNKLLIYSGLGLGVLGIAYAILK